MSPRRVWRFRNRRHAGKLTRFVLSVNLLASTRNVLVMPEITVSDDLYRQLEAESRDTDVTDTLWEMVGSYRRANNPESDMG